MQLVGRDADLARLQNLITNGANLVTILGPPGMGKTTLARALLRAHEPRPLFVSLDGVDDVPLAVRAIAVGIGLTDGSSSAGRIAEHLSAIDATALILDNLEQLPAGFADELRDLLAAAPQLAIVATSRRRIGLADETVLELAPLTLGDQGAAADLFVRRARQLEPGWASDDREAINAVLEHTAGVPLAIEIAAARLRLVNLKDLARRLERRLDDPASAPSAGPLAASVETSWQLLSADEKRALSALSRLPTQFPLALAERVAGSVATNPLELIQSLRDNSLLSRNEGGLTILPFVREFSLRESGDIDWRAVDRSVCDLAAELADRFLETGRAEDLGALGDYVVALMSVLESGSKDLAELAAGPLAVYYMRRGDSSGRTRFLRVLERQFPTGTAVPVSLALRAAGVCTRHDTCDEGLRWLSRIEDADKDAVTEAKMAVERAALLNTARRHDEALVELDAAIPVLRDLREHIYVLRALVSKFVAHYYLADLPAARTSAVDTLRYADQFPESPDYFVAVVLNNLCFLNSILGNAVEAREQGAKALEMFELAGDGRAATMVHGYLGLLEMNLGDLEAAEDHFETAAHSHRAMGDRLQEAFNLANLAELSALSGDYDRTVRLLHESERVAARVEWPGIEVHNAGVRATLALSAGDLVAAEDAFTLGLEHPSASTMPNEFAYFTAFRALLRRLADQSDWREFRDAAYERVGQVTNPHFRAAFSVISLGLEEVGTAEFSEKARMACRTRAVGVADQPSLEDSFLVRRAWWFLERHLPKAGWLEVRAWAEDPGSSGVVCADGSDRFRLPGGEWLDLSRRSTQAAMFRELIRATAGGQSRTTEELFEAVWPGETAHPESASNRVYNALALLRRNGAADFVVRDDSGYRIAPGIELHLLESRGDSAQTQNPGTSS